MPTRHPCLYPHQPRHHDRPQHARFVSPIAMIGFGSIGRGTLPLIERHIAFDRSKFVVTAALTAFLRAAVLSVAIGVIPSAHANDLSFGASRAARGADPDQQGRQGYYTGIVVIGDQTFHYGSGRPGLFSIPYGSYELHIPPIQMGTSRIGNSPPPRSGATNATLKNCPTGCEDCCELVGRPLVRPRTCPAVDVIEHHVDPAEPVAGSRPHLSHQLREHCPKHSISRLMRTPPVDAR
jgi:hypothetical protein